MVRKREVSGGIFPVYMQVENETCLVVGGGKVDRRKVKKLADCGACVILIAPECTPALRGLAESGHIEIKERKPFESNSEYYYRPETQGKIKAGS